MKQKILISLLMIALFISAFSMAAMAASDEANSAANALYKQGLFLGTGTDANGNPNFDLDRAPTRHEAVVMLVRLLGKEAEAKAGCWETPFTDVADWAVPYVGYAYENGLTVGTGATTFGGNNVITVSQYLTFVLRALGYENGVDFQWDKAWELSDKLGFTDGRYGVNTAFTRGDVAIISNNSLDIPKKGATVYSEGLAYKVNDDGKSCTITGIGTCKDTKILIPEKIDNYTVTGIGDRAFSKCENIKFIEIPETVEKIGSRAFYGCTGLSEITIPESVNDIGEQIFYKASNLHTVYYNSAYGSAENLIFDSTNVTKVVFGGSIVPDYILDDGSNWIMGTINNDSIIVKDIEILDSVTSIGQNAFVGCQKLTNITIPDSVTHIGEGAFQYCSDLQSVTIPDSVTSIEDFTFFLSGLQSITIPDSVTSIGNHAFHFCWDLTSITIPDSVTSIGNSAFIATGLTNITIPDSVTSIGYGAFTNCDGLTNITIPDSLKSIATEVFSECDNLTSVTIPDSVTNIGINAFENCIKLTSIYYDNTKARWNSIIKEGWDDIWDCYGYWDTNTGNYTIYCTDGIITKDQK